MKKTVIALLIALSCLLPLTALAESESAPSLPEESGGESEYENVFETVYLKVCEYMPEILSGAAFIGSLILAFAFKRGLLPIVKGSIGAIGDAVGEISLRKDEDGRLLDTISSTLGEGLSLADEAIKELGAKIDLLTTSLESAERRAGDRETLFKVINGQIDMLYDVFMSSSLPHFQKEAVGAKIAEMREAVRADAGE